MSVYVVSVCSVCFCMVYRWILHLCGVYICMVSYLCMAYVSVFVHYVFVWCLSMLSVWCICLCCDMYLYTDVLFCRDDVRLYVCVLCHCMVCL